MNSRLITYLGNQVRPFLIISQVISDAKLYLKYPSESAQLITTIVPENINDYIFKICKHHSLPNRQINTTTTNLLTTNFNEEIIDRNRLHSRLWSWFHSNIKTT